MSDDLEWAYVMHRVTDVISLCMEIHQTVTVWIVVGVLQLKGNDALVLDRPATCRGKHIQGRRFLLSPGRGWKHRERMHGGREKPRPARTAERVRAWAN